MIFYSIFIDSYSGDLYMMFTEATATSKSIEAFLTHGHLSILRSWHTEQVVLHVWFRFETDFSESHVCVYTYIHTCTPQSSVDNAQTILQAICLNEVPFLCNRLERQYWSSCFKAITVRLYEMFIWTCGNC